MSIRVKVAAVITAVFVLGAVAVALFMGQYYDQRVEEAAMAAVSNDRAVFMQLQADDTAKLSSTALALAQNDAYREAYLAQDRERLLELASPVFEQLKADFDITHWYFESTADKGDVFLRVHKPAQFGDTLKRKTYLTAAETKAPSAGLELGATAVALRVVHPYYAADGTTVVGYMELGQEIEEFLGAIKSQTGDEVGLLLVKESMDSSGWAAMRTSAKLEDNWDDQPEYVLAAATDEAAADEMVFDRAVADVDAEGEIVGTFERADGSTVVRGVFPIEDAVGTRIGLVHVSHDITDTASALQGSVLKVLAAVVAMMVLVLFLVIVLMNRLVFGRLDAMIAGMEDISLRLMGGDFDVVYSADARKDEIGAFDRFFAQFLAVVTDALKQLSQRAQ